LAAAVIVSGIVAVTLSPVMSAKMLSASGKEGFLTRLVNRAFASVQESYARLLKLILPLRWGIVASTLLVTVAAIPLYMLSAKELAPTEDQGAVGVFLQASPDATLKSSKKWCSALASKFEEVKETDYMWALATSAGGFGGVITTDWSERDRGIQPIYKDIYDRAVTSPGMEAFPNLMPSLPGAGQYDVELILKSDLPVERQLEIAQEIVKRGTAANMFMYCQTDLKLDLPQARVIVDREKLADLGLDQAAVGQELGVLLGGAYVNRFNYFNRSYQVIPQLEEQERQSTSALMDLRIRAPSGELIPVSTFASIVPETAPRSLQRFQQQSSVRVFAGVYPGVTKAAGLDTLEGIAKEVLGPSGQVDFGGESRQIRKEGSALTVTLGFALLLIYLVLAAQFKSFRDPLIVLIGSVPLAISGALTLTFLNLTTINIYSQVGLITLVGLVAKNGILIVEFANHLQEQGLTKLQAIVEASKTRLRPVLMTSAATVLGHFPLVLVTGPGAAARNSIGIVLVAGMIIGTFFTLFVVPAIYLIIAAQHKHEESEEFVEPPVQIEEPELAYA
jgi:multidrug efflux pump